MCVMRFLIVSIFRYRFRLRQYIRIFKKLSDEHDSQESDSSVGIQLRSQTHSRHTTA